MRCLCPPRGSMLRRTVDNLVHECDDFWRSSQLWATLKEGQLLRIDPAFFAQRLLTVLQEGRDAGRHSKHSRTRHSPVDDRGARAANRVVSSIEKFVGSCPHALLCRRLLHLLQPDRLMEAAAALVSASPNEAGESFSSSAARSQHHIQSARERVSPSEAATLGVCYQENAGRGAAERLKGAKAAALREVVRAHWNSLEELLVAHAAVMHTGRMWQWMQGTDVSQVPSSLALCPICFGCDGLHACSRWSIH